MKENKAAMLLTVTLIAQKKPNSCLYCLSQFVGFLFGCGKKKWSQLFNFQTGWTYKPHSSVSQRMLPGQFPNHMGYHCTKPQVRTAFTLIAVVTFKLGIILTRATILCDTVVRCPLVEVCKGSGAAITTTSPLWVNFLAAWVLEVKHQTLLIAQQGQGSA